MNPPVNKWVVAVSVALGSLMASIDSSIVNVAIPVIRGELGASIQEITWVSTAYLIAMVLVMPLTGFLGALFGQKRIYLLSLATFVAGSALCGTAHSLEALVVFRVLQGLGGGALQPTQQAILRQTFPPEEQGMAMAVFALVIMVGPAVGPVLGGWITDNYSWPWIFYINLPVGVLGILMTVRNVHEPEDVRAANRQRAEVQRRHLDWAGIALMVIGVGSLQFLLEEGPQHDWFDSAAVQAAAFIAVFGIAAFIIRELTATAPVVNLRLFADPTFAAGTAIATVMFGMLMGSLFLLPLFMQELQGQTATASGLALLPRTLSMMAMSVVVGRIYNKVRPAVLVGLGVLLFGLGSWQLGHSALATTSTDLIVPMVITGAGFAFLFVPLTTAALSRTPRHLLADAAGLNSFLRQMGGSVGLTVFATLFTHFSVEAGAAMAGSVSALRPEVVDRLSTLQGHLVASGASAAQAHGGALASVAGALASQSAVLGFDRTCVLQALSFLLILPLLYFLRVPRGQGRGDAPVAAHLAAE
ncbi:MAG TPA: DHA2 family efflux MFS transporter permease subunit [Kofleriaceae bacterium]|nr:DHA2 family efflux MFS transporter permease subunit [Kofleriaceae bacterium]